MPTSDYHQISDVLHVIEQVRPARVLEVGVGFGKWGFLCREILDVYYERVQPESWTTVIDGIEIYEPYRNPTWDLAYNEIHIGDAREILPRLGQYDLIMVQDAIPRMLLCGRFQPDDWTRSDDPALDAESAIGNGSLTVIRGTPPEGKPYTSQILLGGSGIATDLTRYLMRSEQIASAVLLGVLNRRCDACDTGKARVGPRAIAQPSVREQR